MAAARSASAPGQSSTATESRGETHLTLPGVDDEAATAGVDAGDTPAVAGADA